MNVRLKMHVDVYAGNDSNPHLVASPNQCEGSILRVQQSRLPGRDPHAVALWGIWPLEQLLEFRGVGCPLWRDNGAGMFLPWVVHTKADAKQAVACVQGQKHVLPLTSSHYLTNTKSCEELPR